MFLKRLLSFTQLAPQVMQDFESTDEHLVRLHPQILTYSKTSDYSKLASILKQYPDLIKSDVQEALLIRALVWQILDKPVESKSCVIASLILKYTHQLGQNGLDTFFARLSQGTGNPAQKLFFDDVQKTFDHMVNRGKILRKEQIAKIQKQEAEEEARLQQQREIYEKFLQPDGSLKIPLGENPSQNDIAVADWFDNLPHYYKEGLLLEDIEKINQFLTSLPPEESEKQAEMAIKAGFIQMDHDEE
jgi:cell division cycle protein 37